jgi:hypothetical protein
VVGVDVERRDLGGPVAGGAIAGRGGDAAEADDRAVALGDERALRRLARREPLAPRALAPVDRQPVEDRGVDDPAVARLPAADVDGGDRPGVRDRRVPDDDGARDQAPDRSQSPRLVKPTITTSM